MLEGPRDTPSSLSQTEQVAIRNEQGTRYKSYTFKDFAIRSFLLTCDC